jgi:hypothetical protein
LSIWKLWNYKHFHRVGAGKPYGHKVKSSYGKPRIIRGLPTDQFTFDDLHGQVSTDYETLKDVVFVLLSEAPASIKQVFDTEAKTMRLVRVKR